MDGKSLNISESIISKLKEVIPGVFTENQINFDQLKLLLGENINSETERYQLSWAGKNLAYKELQTTVSSTLYPKTELSENWEATKNIFIEGENLEVLKVLQKAYFGKIKMITIDPPYNTGNDSFIYPDKFTETKTEYLKKLGDKNITGKLIKEDLFKPNKKESGHFHSNWLSMMLPRLFIARNLLREDGVLFISIDDNEAYTLKLLLDEIFGEENFLGNIIWNSTKSVTNTALLSVSHTHNLVYFKNLEYHKKNRFDFRLPDTPVGFSNPDNDPRGPWKADPFQVEGERPNQLYKITNPKTGREYFPNPGCSWKNDYNKFQELLADNRIIFGTTGEAGPQRKRFWSEAQERGRVAKSLWIDVDTTANATSYLELLTGKKVFTNPKPVDLIQRFIQLGTKNEGDIILDFFGGSGTAAEAVFRQNIADNKKRSFIFVTLPEIIDETTQAGKNAKSLGCETISEVARLRINKAIEKIKKEDYLLKPTKKETEISKQDLGYKFFTCGPSNFKIWRSGEIENENDLLQQLSFFDTIEKQEAKELDLVYEIIIKNGFDLNSKVEKILIDGTVVYNINSFLLLLATKKMNIEIASQLCEYQPKTIICLDSVFKNHDSLKTNIQLLFEESGITFKTI